MSFQSGFLKTCLAGQKKGWNDLGRNPTVDAVGVCPDQRKGEAKYSRAAWAWNSGVDGTGGHLRPWSPRGAARPLCLDANVVSAFGRRAPFGLDVTLVGCNPLRRSQRWVWEQNRLVNMESKLCLRALRAPEGDRRTTHKDRTPEEKDVVIEMVPCVVGRDSEQEWLMVTIPDHVENKRYGICESSDKCEIDL